MNLHDAKRFLAKVGDSGFLNVASPNDFAIVDEGLGILSKPDWLVFGNYQGTPIVCLEGTERANLFIPESELDSKQEAISFKELEESYDFVETRGNVEQYVHKVTGRSIYIGRTENRPILQAEQIQANPADTQPEQTGWRQLWKRVSHFFVRRPARSPGTPSSRKCQRHDEAREACCTKQTCSDP